MSNYHELQLMDMSRNELVFHLRHNEHETYTAIARRFGVSKQRANQIYKLECKNRGVEPIMGKIEA